MKKMKRLLTTLLIALVSFVAVAQNDTTKVTIPQDIPTLSAKDSLVLGEMYKLISRANLSAIPRFKMYKTDNLYNLIKLDTATGKLWQVQYEMNKDSEAMVVPIDDYSLLYWTEQEVEGRYELYPTNNSHTFILLDTKLGYTYQVQWSTKPDNRFRVRLY